jgi:uncharacterized membrane protein (DUF373 family)
MPMLDLKTLKQEWNDLTSYQRFEQVITRIVMAFVAVVIVFSVVMVAIELAKDFMLGDVFIEQELLQDVFGSILTVLILLEFNHSIAVSLKQKTGVIQARIVVLIAILVIARKIILLDFKTASIETLAAHAGVALALGALYWHASRALEPFLVCDGLYPPLIPAHAGIQNLRQDWVPACAGTSGMKARLATNALLRPRLRGHRRGVGADQCVEVGEAATAQFGDEEVLDLADHR